MGDDTIVLVGKTKACVHARAIRSNKNDLYIIFTCKQGEKDKRIAARGLLGQATAMPMALTVLFGNVCTCVRWNASKNDWRREGSS